MSFDFRAKGAWPRYFKDKLLWKPWRGRDLPVASLLRPQVAEFEKELLEAGVSVAHLTSTQPRQIRAIRQFFQASGLPKVFTSWFQGPSGASVKFAVCVMQGASFEHVPVMVLDGLPSEFDQRALADAWYIPALTDGVMPIVVGVVADVRKA